MRIQVIGAGSWGLALARLLALNGHGVWLWCREEDGPDVLSTARQSPHYLPGVLLPSSVRVETRIHPDVDMAILAVPSHAMRSFLSQHPFPRDVIRVNAAKGIENTTLCRMTEVIREIHGPCPVVTLTGPSHAEEVARDLPASVVAAGRDQTSRVAVQRAFMSKSFRVYTSPDIVGAELGGSLKNVIAIAAGICDGFALGDNAKAALMTRGLAEIARLGVAMGGDPLTFAGLSGMGDLIVTCGSRHSRNRALGEQIAQGRTLDEVTRATRMVAEGVRTAQSAMALAGRHGIEMPITAAVHQILFDGMPPRDAISSLMDRDPKPERI